MQQKNPAPAEKFGIIEQVAQFGKVLTLRKRDQREGTRLVI
jgi:hypothetical protein